MCKQIVFLLLLDIDARWLAFYFLLFNILKCIQLMLHCYYCIINLSIHTTGKIYRDSSLRSNRSGKTHQRYEKENNKLRDFREDFDIFKYRFNILLLEIDNIYIQIMFNASITFFFFFYNSFFPPFLLFPLVYIFSSHFNSSTQ